MLQELKEPGKERVRSGLMALLWTGWGFAAFWAAFIVFGYVVFPLHLRFFKSVINFMRDLGGNFIHNMQWYDFFMMHLAEWLIAFILVVVLSTFTRKKVLWFLLFWAGFVAWPLSEDLASLIVNTGYHRDFIKETFVRLWYFQVAHLFIVLPVCIYLGFFGGERLNKRREVRLKENPANQS
jgi:hypothetical protein